MVLRRYPDAEYEIWEKNENLFSTTIHVLASAVQKIARKESLPPGLMLYRGFGN
jgi:hypothetical protein